MPHALSTPSTTHKSTDVPVPVATTRIPMECVSNWYSNPSTAKPDNISISTEDVWFALDHAKPANLQLSA